jgi:diguanylate cyclase (GGDEF)-like protein
MHPIEKFLEWIYASRSRAVAVAFGLVAITGLADYVTGYAMAVSLFYLLPVLLVTHVLGKRMGFLVAGLAAGIWTLAQLATGFPNSNWLQSAWNMLMRFGILLIVAYLLLAFEAEMKQARCDYLTNLGNRRQFMRMLEAERNRSAHTGKPYSILYLDIDRFKTLNDTLGHAVGDEALRVVAGILRAHSRRMDVPARLGGDEFVVLLSDTHETDCRIIADRLHRAVADEIEKRWWPIGVSIGTTTIRGAEKTADEILRAADQAMYRIKRPSADR